MKYVFLATFLCGTSLLSADIRPPGVTPNEWVRISDTLGVFIIKVEKRATIDIEKNPVIETLEEALKDELDRLNQAQSPPEKEAIERAIQKYEEKLKKLASIRHQIAKGFLMAKIDGAWTLIELEDLPSGNIFRYLESPAGTTPDH
ncbi:MAG: hypothetical protein AAFY98_00955 [Verrucomicrobiota bacterium]